MNVLDVQDKDEFGGVSITLLREQKKAAELGYVSMNLLEPPEGAHWGEFNDRKVDPDWVSTLLKSFENNLDNCTDQTAVEAAVKKSWLKNPDQIIPSVEGKLIQSIPKLEFTDEGKTAILPKNLWMLGGNHRREALIQLVTKWKAQLKEKRKQIGKMEAEEQSGIGGTIDDEEELESLQKSTKKLEELIRSSSVWVVRLYDRGVDQ